MVIVMMEHGAIILIVMNLTAMKVIVLQKSVVMAAAEAVAIEAAWPSGKNTIVPLKPSQAEVVLSYPSEP